MMHRQGRYRIASADQARILEIPYKGDDAAMIVALPDKVDGLADLEKGMSEAKLS
jgi:serine protease inhibitor